MLRAIFTGWLHAFVISIALTGGAMSSVEGRRVAAPVTEYDGVSFGELIAVYKQAYADAGFKLKEQTTRKEQGPGGRDITRLVFEFAIPEYPHKTKGVASFVLMSSGSANQNCAPCSAHPEILGGETPDYSLEEYAIFTQRINSAAVKANDRIKAKLGSSVRPAKVYQRPPGIE